jgi:mono/diheme cytochrome c family protein
MKRRSWTIAAAATLALAAAAVAFVAWANVRGETRMHVAAAAVAATPQQVERGAYLARVGNCAACHTERGGPLFAGGRGIATPFGTVYASNLTPDPETGLGTWTSAEFWRAMHHGRSRDGGLLYPAFPYPDYTRVTREDSDALHAYLRSVPAVKRENRPHDLRFPYDTQAALAVWRALFFTPGTFVAQPERSAEWNRGAYLVNGLGHCQACHTPRNAFGASSEQALAGGLVPMQNWYAPSLAAPAEAGVQDWEPAEVVQLLRTGKSARGAALGPMAEVVHGSTQHMTDADLRAMATFLREVPREATRVVAARPADAETLVLGQRIYDQACAQCHGERGEGGGDAYPPLAGHRTVTMPSSANLVRVILSGGFPPTTQGNPRPYGMPPFGQALSDVEIAALASYVRRAWGNDASAVQPLDVQRMR